MRGSRYFFLIALLSISLWIVGCSSESVEPQVVAAIPSTATPVPPTATSVPPPATPVPPTATSVPPAATSVPPAATSVPPTATSVPPTATSVPPTTTSVPPTATSVPPTATAVPPTATAIPPTPTRVPLPPRPTHIPIDASVKARLISIGFNVPQTGSLDEANHEFIGGLNVDPTYKERWVEVQNSINSVLGGYPNFIMMAYDKSGTDEDIQPLGERLTELQFPGDTNSSMYVENWTVQDLDRYKTCLTGGDTGKKGTSTTNPHSMCIMEYEKFGAYRYEPVPPTAKNHAQLAIHDAHEYFHHYQKAHALERGLDLASDPDNPETTVQAPRWWIEGAAVSFSNAWYKSNWDSLSFMKDQKVSWYGEDFNLANANNGYVATADFFKKTKRMVRGELSEHEMGAGCTSDWYLHEGEEDAATETRCFSSLMAVAYMAHLTSWKTVWIDIPQDYYDLGFWGSFEKHMRMEKQEFYDAYNNLFTSGDVNDEPPEGWTFPEGPISGYADFLKIVPESDTN